MSYRWTVSDLAAHQRTVDGRSPPTVPAIMRSTRAREISLWLPWPPSVNRLYRADEGRGRRLRDEQLRYREHVRAGCLEHRAPRMDGRLAVTVTLYAPTRARYDLDNRAKAILDALEGAGVIPNDEQVDRLELIRGERGVSHGPGAMVQIRRIQSEER